RGHPRVRRHGRPAVGARGRAPGPREAAVSVLAAPPGSTGQAPPGARWFGVHPALVTDVKDPDGQGRVKVSLPWSPDASGDGYAAWARLAPLLGGADEAGAVLSAVMGGANLGPWLVPDSGYEVLVGSEGGDPRRPYVLGG